LTGQAMDFIASCLKIQSLRGEVLEVGSFDVNGSPRKLFADCKRFPKYTGMDMREGPGVDLIANAQSIPLPDESVDVIVCAEMLEHDSAFWVSLAEMYRVLRTGGHLIATTVSFLFKQHDYPKDYWRFSKEGLQAAIEGAGFPSVVTAENAGWRCVFAVAQK